ncbi:MAG: DNA methyltransferase [SAR202 cluster bacterium]|nr:DNA methyltransferase [SAR202 cluster bacterium]
MTDPTNLAAALPGVGQVQAAMVQGTARGANQLRDGGSQPTSPLQTLLVRPIPIGVAKGILEQRHYLHSLPGGTGLAFGTFLNSRLLGALTLGFGPKNAHRLVQGASPADCLTLTRLWLSDELPKNSESRVLGIVLRALKRETRVKFLLSYADPSQGHLGGIYQATGWVYTGLSQATPLYDIGDGQARHSRSLSHSYGSHSLEHFARHGVTVRLVEQTAKHRYLHFLDAAWQDRLTVAALPYPKSEVKHGRD